MLKYILRLSSAIVVGDMLFMCIHACMHACMQWIALHYVLRKIEKRISINYVNMLNLLRAMASWKSIWYSYR